MTFFEEQALRYPCHYCKVAPGEWCVAKTTGEPSRWLHSVRQDPIRRAFDHGFHKGWHEAKGHTARILDKIA